MFMHKYVTIALEEASENDLQPLADRKVVGQDIISHAENRAKRQIGLIKKP